MGSLITADAVSRAEGYSAIPSPFAMDDATFRALGHRLVETLGSYLDKLPSEPAYRPVPAEVRKALEEMSIPAEGTAPGGCHRKLPPPGAAIRSRPESSVLRRIR
jgi:hypothetical protein